MAKVLLIHPMLGSAAWRWLQECLGSDISTSVFEPTVLHTWDREVEAAALYEQMLGIDDTMVDLAVAVGGACGPAAHAFVDQGWLPHAGLILLEPDARSLVERFPEVRKIVVSRPHPSALAVAFGRLGLATAKQLPGFLSGDTADATEKAFQDLGSSDRQREWAHLMAEATRKKEPIEDNLRDISGLGKRLVGWYEPWAHTSRDVQAWFRENTGLARFADQEAVPRGRYQIVDCPPAAWINAPETLAGHIEDAVTRSR